MSPVMQGANNICFSIWLTCLSYYIVNSSDAEDGIFWIWGSIPCLLMPWLLKSPEHQQAWYWLCRTNNTYHCFRVDFIYLGQAKSKIWFKMQIHLLWSLKWFSMLRVNIFSVTFMNFLTPQRPNTIRWLYESLGQIKSNKLYKCCVMLSSCQLKKKHYGVLFYHWQHSEKWKWKFPAQCNKVNYFTRYKLLHHTCEFTA